MRIISGKFKGKSINFLKNLHTRPLKDAVRENIFNILTHSNLIQTKIENSNVLDLYSGIGSFGIECVSRAAAKVTFVEKNMQSFNILKKNLIELTVIDKAKIYNKDVKNALLYNINEKFNIFFFDPPFLDSNFLENLKLIKEKKIYENNHIVIIHRNQKKEDNFENLIKIIEKKIYGRSKIIFGIFN